jgi:hypothetical protein
MIVSGDMSSSEGLPWILGGSIIKLLRDRSNLVNDSILSFIIIRIKEAVPKEVHGSI